MDDACIVGEVDTKIERRPVVYLDQRYGFQVSSHLSGIWAQEGQKGEVPPSKSP